MSEPAEPELSPAPHPGLEGTGSLAEPWPGGSGEATGTQAGSLQRRLAAWLPSQCEVCRGWNPERLCTACRARHAAPQARCTRCGLRTGSALAACGDCLREPPPFRHTHCAVDYSFPWVQLLQAFKFHGQDDLARPLAALMADALRLDQAKQPQLLLPVPLSSERLQERGYNQAWELGRQLGRMMKIPARADVLLRVHQTATQADLSRTQRQQNLRGAFMVPPRAAGPLQGSAVALVDDVMTTGATVREAARVLLQSGAASVDVWVLARTPAPAG